MALPPEYEAYLRANLNWFERLSQSFTSLDERIDYTNILLTRLIELQGGAPPVKPPWVDELITAIEHLASIGIGVVPNKEAFITRQKTVTTAGTAVKLASSIPIPDGFGLTIIAKPGNTGTIYIGRTKGDAEGSQTFNGLSAGLAVSLKVTNTDLVWVNGDTDGDGVSWIVEQ